MRAFRYTALDPAGKRLSRVAYASDAARLRDELIEARLHPLAIRRALFQGVGRLSLNQAEAARLARDLARLMKSGMSLGQALGLLASRESPRLAAAAKEIRSRLTAGEPLSGALRAIEGPSSLFLQALARAGEASGRQAEILAAGAASLAAADQLRRRMITLSVYPAFVIAIAVGSIAVYAYAVLPALEPAFASFGDDLPLQTRLVLRFGQVVRIVMPTLALIGGTAAILLILSAAARRRTADVLAGLVLRLKTSPLRDYLFANLASRLAVMLEAGVPLSAAWRLAAAPVTIGPVQRALQAQDNRLMEGARLSAALSAVPQTPPDLVHHVMLGEQSGHTPRALSEAAETLAVRAQESIERALSLLTPVVIILVGVMVGLITMMVFQGLLAVGDAVS